MQRLSVFRSRFFWKLFLAHSSLFLGMVLVAGYLIYGTFKKSVLASVENTLQDKLELAGDETPFLMEPESLPQRVSRLKTLANKMHVRLTVIDNTGTILADSQYDPMHMDNHWGRPEVQLALQQTYGSARRNSETMNEEAMYVAKAVRENGEVLGILRAAVPMNVIQKELNDIRFKIVLISLVVSILALGIGLVLMRRITIPIREMMLVSEAMRQGQYGQQVRTLPNDEIGLLGDTLNRLGQEIMEKIARISLDRAQLKTIMANMVEGIIALDDENRIQFCNRAAYDLLGSNLGDCRGMKLESVMGFDLLAGIVDEARQTRKLAEEEIRIRDENTNLFLECYASTYRGAEASGIIVVIHDISDVRKLEGMRRDFVANVSHELKTPLTAIKGYTETLLSGALEEKDTARRFIEKVEDNTDRLVTLVKGLLSLAQIESQNEPLDMYPVQPHAVLTELMKRHEDGFRKKDLKVRLSGDASIAVMAERDALTTVLENLMTNAARYTGSGGEIALHVERKHDHVVISISDTGIGIKQKHLDRIFQRFYRIDKARSRELGGTGLGLSIVKHLMTRMGGRVTVESEVGTGSTFKIYLRPADSE